MNQDEYFRFQRELVGYAISVTEGGMEGLGNKLKVRRETVLRWFNGKHIMSFDHAIGVLKCIGIESTERFIKKAVVVDGL